jgi:hypothetical protein
VGRHVFERKDNFTYFPLLMKEEKCILDGIPFSSPLEEY